MKANPQVTVVLCLVGALHKNMLGVLVVLVYSQSAGYDLVLVPRLIPAGWEEDLKCWNLLSRVP